MSTHNREELEQLAGHVELTERLRSMSWPEPSPEARQRSWQLLRAQLDGGGMAKAPRERRPVGRERHEERRLRPLEFAARACQGYGGALGERVAATRGMSRVRLG